MRYNFLVSKDLCVFGFCFYFVLFCFVFLNILSICWRVEYESFVLSDFGFVAFIGTKKCVRLPLDFLSQGLDA